MCSPFILFRDCHQKSLDPGNVIIVDGGIYVRLIKFSFPMFSGPVRLLFVLLSPLFFTSWVPGFARVPYYAPIPCHDNIFMHPVCHHIKSCHRPVKQYITTHHNTQYIYPFTMFCGLFCALYTVYWPVSSSGTSLEVSLAISFPCSSPTLRCSLLSSLRPCLNPPSLSPLPLPPLVPSPLLSLSQCLGQFTHRTGLMMVLYAATLSIMGILYIIPDISCHSPQLAPTRCLTSQPPFSLGI